MKICPFGAGSTGTVKVVRNPVNRFGASTSYSISPEPLTASGVTLPGDCAGIAPHSSSFTPPAPAAPTPAPPAPAIAASGIAVAPPRLSAVGAVPTRANVPADAADAPPRAVVLLASRTGF